MKIKICASVFLVLGLTLCTIVLIFKLYLFPKIIYKELKKIVPLVNNTEAYERWENLPLPITYKIYFFNVTNPDEIMNNSKPILEEIGPYVYQQYRSKYNVTEDEDTLAYNENMYFEFDVNASYPRTEFDQIQIINVPLLAVLGTAEKELRPLLPILNKMLNDIFNSPKDVFLTTTVKDFLFDGVFLACNTNNTLMEMACRLIEVYSTQTLVRQEDGRFKFSFLSHKHHRDEGRFMVNSGIYDVQKLGQLLAWKNASTVDVWRHEGTCNNIKGTDSTIYPPFLYKNSKFDIFSTDICRSMPLEYAKSISYSGVNGFRYVAKKAALASPKTEPENQCFCLSATQGIRKDDQCLLDGALELFSCQGGPIVFTYPHYYQADETYQNGVIGMKPNAEKHQNFVDIEPWSGTPLRGGKRAQFSLFVREIPNIILTKSLETTLVPFLWLDEGVELTDNLIDQLNVELLDILNLATIYCWSAFACGAILFIISIIVCCWRTTRQPTGVIEQVKKAH